MKELHEITHVRGIRRRRSADIDNVADFRTRAAAERLKRLRVSMPGSETFEII